VIYRSTPEQSYVDFIQSVNTDTSPILSVVWNISLLKFASVEECPTNMTEKSINLQRLGVFLLSMIQRLCKHEQSSIKLYLQCDYTKHSFLRFISIGFWYSLKHYIALTMCAQVKGEFFSFCVKSSELLCLLYALARKGQICYRVVSDTQNNNIWLLFLTESLQEWFPPLMPIQQHPLLTEWLFSVPFPFW